MRCERRMTPVVIDAWRSGPKRKAALALLMDGLLDGNPDVLVSPALIAELPLRCSAARSSLYRPLRVARRRT
jgi:hypothetical protein